MSSNIYAYGLGSGTLNARNEWLEVWYPQPQLQPDAKLSGLLDKWTAESAKPLTAESAGKLEQQLRASGYNAEADLLAQLSQGRRGSRPESSRSDRKSVV